MVRTCSWVPRFHVWNLLGLSLRYSGSLGGISLSGGRQYNHNSSLGNLQPIFTPMAMKHTGYVLSVLVLSGLEAYI